jgi:hypothetical protein
MSAKVNHQPAKIGVAGESSSTAAIGPQNLM